MLIASCSESDNRACWYSLRLSSSATPSRNRMYKAMIRTLSIDLSVSVAVLSAASPPHVIVRSSSNGTISSTIVFGVFPSGVKPVAQHCG